VKRYGIRESPCAKRNRYALSNMHIYVHITLEKFVRASRAGILSDSVCCLCAIEFRGKRKTSRPSYSRKIASARSSRDSRGPGIPRETKILLFEINIQNIYIYIYIYICMRIYRDSLENWLSIDASLHVEKIRFREGPSARQRKIHRELLLLVSLFLETWSNKKAVV